MLEKADRLARPSNMREWVRRLGRRTALGLPRCLGSPAFLASSQYEALARYSFSREFPRSVLKCEMVLGTLDATSKVP